MNRREVLGQGAHACLGAVAGGAVVGAGSGAVSGKSAEEPVSPPVSSASVSPEQPVMSTQNRHVTALVVTKVSW